MQSNFHHVAPQLCARLTGFARCGAAIIDQRAQHADDAHESEVVCCDNGFCDKQTASEYCLPSYQPKDSLLNHHNTLAFHFLLGHCGQSASSISCLSSHDKVLDAIRLQNKAYARYLLGSTRRLAMVSWTNRRFSGISQHRKDISRNIDFSLQRNWNKKRTTIEYFDPQKAENRYSIWQQWYSSSEFSLYKKTPCCHDGKFTSKYKAPGKDTPSPAQYRHHDMRVPKNHRKRFHDVEQAHNLVVLNEWLPQYGVMAV